ncbi:MAG: nuclear transport factor 2 family protein [Acidimicrobiales bacterium]
MLAANQAFYDAFEACDLDAMSDLWLHDDRSVCTHPGWATLRGWAAIGASWFAIFQNPERLQLILTNVNANVSGDLAWVSLDENLLAARASGTVAALNVFERIEGRWRLVAHHGSSVLASQS